MTRPSSRQRSPHSSCPHSAQAEACLSRAIKLDGSLAEGWVALGECFWKKGDLAAAETCFTGMPDFEKNKDGLRNMSMVLRKVRASNLASKHTSSHDY